MTHYCTYSSGLDHEAKLPLDTQAEGCLHMALGKRRKLELSPHSPRLFPAVHATKKDLLTTGIRDTLLCLSFSFMTFPSFFVGLLSVKLFWGNFCFLNKISAGFLYSDKHPRLRFLQAARFSFLGNFLPAAGHSQMTLQYLEESKEY